MFDDLRSLVDGARLEADLCIIGAGAAGITIAREFIGRSERVLLIESGGLGPDDQVQALYDGDIIGMPYPAPLDAARIRFLGGSTNHWGGTCWPLREEDFLPRDWIADSGWPLRLADLDGFYRQAQTICQLGPYIYDQRLWASDFPALPDVDRRKLQIAFAQYSPPTQFGAVYREDLAKAENIRVVLNANATELRLSESHLDIKSLALRTLDKRTASVEARKFVLACGGIENPRLLLASDRQAGHGIGNQHGNVGRYFMDHIYAASCTVVVPDGSGLVDAFDERPVPSWKTRAKPALFVAPAEQKRKRILGGSVYFATTESDYGDGVRAALALRHELKQGKYPKNLGGKIVDILGDIDEVVPAVYHRLKGTPADQWRPSRLALMVRSEQAPNRDSRVVLSDERDATGLRKADLDWQLSDLDRRSIRHLCLTVGRELGRLDLARIKLDSWLRPERGGWLPNFSGGAHHMGTTRMSETAARGVVDKNCKIHGLANLYVAGSSVFPTSGFVNPTLTIVALSLRLAHHLRSG